MAELKLENWEGNAKVTKEGRNLVFEWPCAARFFITPRALDRLIDQFALVSKIKGTRLPATDLKVRSFGVVDGGLVEADDVYLEVVGTKITPIVDFDRSGTFTVSDLKRAVKKALA